METKVVRFDWAIKHLLRDKANFDILEGFLSTLLNDDNIRIIDILESETNQDDEVDKYNRVDILVNDSNNRKIYIEIQNTREVDYIESLLFASSKIIVEHQELGKDFSNISKVISISILYFNLGRGTDYIYYGRNDFKGLNTGETLKIKKRIETQKDTDGFEIKYKFIEKNIFPEYYLITVERYKNIVKKRIDEWIYMFKNNEIPKNAKSKGMDKVKQKLNVMNMSDEQRKLYEKHLINTARDKKAWRDNHEHAYTEGEIAGIEQGIEQGIELEKENSKRIIKQAEEQKKQAEEQKKQAEEREKQAVVEKLIFKLHFKEGKKIEEIAEILRESLETIQKIIEEN